MGLVSDYEEAVPNRCYGLTGFWGLSSPGRASVDILIGMDNKLLEQYVQAKLSTYDIAAATGKSQSTVRYWLKKYGLKTSPYKTKRQCLVCEKVCATTRAKYCSNGCQNEAQYNKYILEWKLGNVSGNMSSGRNLKLSNHVRRFIREKHGEHCSICGWNERHKITGKVPTNVDHVDGNPYNTSEDNLRVLCPNHHSLTETYGALNKGNGRKMGL